MSKSFFTGAILLFSLSSMADPTDSSAIQPKDEAILYKRFNKQLDSLESKITFQTGQISLANGHIKLTVPEGFQFINAEQTRFILEDLWGNLEDKDVYGMLVKNGFKVSRLTNDYSFVLSYSDLGYVQDNKDTDLDHADLLSTLQNNMEINNENRISHGVNTMTVKEWVLVPYYDKYKKALYWANKIAVNGSDEEILNYNLRLLGRSGVIKINAVATMDQLPSIKQVLPLIISQTRFEEGQQYADFMAGKDKISNWTINELIAGKDQDKNSISTFMHSPKFWLSLLAIGGAGFAGFSIFKRNRLVMASVQ